jgi:Domain of unknown function (DUF6894)
LSCLKYRPALRFGDRNVPRYFFHFSDGQRQFTDASGHEFQGLEAVRKHASGHMREIKAAMSDPEIPDFAGWTMTVADAAGNTVFELAFDLKPLPPKKPKK